MLFILRRWSSLKSHKFRVSSQKLWLRGCCASWWMAEKQTGMAGPTTPDSDRKTRTVMYTQRLTAGSQEIDEASCSVFLFSSGCDARGLVNPLRLGNVSGTYQKNPFFGSVKKKIEINKKNSIESSAMRRKCEMCNESSAERRFQLLKSLIWGSMKMVEVGS